MSNGTAWQEPFDRLMKALLDGQARDEDRDELEALLLKNEEARTAYCQLLELDAMLKCRNAPLGQEHGEKEASRPLPAFRFWRRYLSWAAAIILCGAGLWYLWRPLAKPKRTASVPYAVLARTISVEWGGAQKFVAGSVLDNKWLVLEGGIAQVVFGCGARAAVRGPARVRVDSATRCTLQYGTMTVLSAASEDIAFEARTPVARIVDSGTEFAVTVDDQGLTELHVLEGEVHVTSLGVDDSKTTLTEESACVVASDGRLTGMAFDGKRFTAIRHRVLKRSTPLRLQFDCGTHRLAYAGTEAPAHAAGDMHAHERTWNLLIGDRSGTFLTADGDLFPHSLSIDFGVGTIEKMNWDAEVEYLSTETVGVFDSALGRDNIRCPQKTADCLGLKIAGLLPGKYRLYLIARSCTVRRSWGNFLVLKQHDVWAGINGYENGAHLVMTPLFDGSASGWLDGETHVTYDFSITDYDDTLYVKTRLDRKSSPQKAGSIAQIQGFQILQLE